MESWLAKEASSRKSVPDLVVVGVTGKYALGWVGDITVPTHRQASYRKELK